MSFKLLFGGIAWGARDQPPSAAVLETDPSVTVGAMPPAASTHRRIEPQRAATPFRAAPIPVPSQPPTSPAARTGAVTKPKVLAAPLPVQVPKSMPEAVAQKVYTPPTGDGHIARAQLTSLVRNREPVDALDATNVSQAQLYFFTEVTGMPGRTVTHRWEYQGQIKHEQRLPIGSARYRTFSKKTLNSRLNGEWKVTVVDDRGKVLTAKTFFYNANDATAETQ